MLGLNHALNGCHVQRTLLRLYHGQREPMEVGRTRGTNYWDPAVEQARWA